MPLSEVPCYKNLSLKINLAIVDKCDEIHNFSGLSSRNIRFPVQIWIIVLKYLVNVAQKDYKCINIDNALIVLNIGT